MEDCIARFKEMYHHTKPLDKPDRGKLYPLSDILSDRGLSLIHQIVLNTNKYPELVGMLDIYLLLNKEEVEKKTDRGLTALHMASRYSNGDSTEDTVSVLLENGANADIQDNNGHTALHMASRYSNGDSTEDTVRILLEHGTDADIQDNNGYTALHMASRYSNGDSTEDTVRMLLEHGTNVDIQDNNGYTALHMASRYSNGGSTEDTVRILLEHGAKVDIQNNKGVTALHLASGNSNGDSTEDTVRILLEHGANTDIQDNEGWSPLFRVIKSNNLPSARLLLLGGADLTLLDKKGRSVFHLASAETKLYISTFDSKLIDCVRRVKILEEYVTNHILYAPDGDNSRFQELKVHFSTLSDTLHM